MKSIAVGKLSRQTRSLVLARHIAIITKPSPPFLVHDVVMVPGLLPTFLHSCEIKSGSGLGWRLPCVLHTWHIANCFFPSVSFLGQYILYSSSIFIWTSKRIQHKHLVQFTLFSSFYTPLIDNVLPFVCPTLIAKLGSSGLTEEKLSIGFPLSQQLLSGIVPRSLNSLGTRLRIIR